MFPFREAAPHEKIIFRGFFFTKLRTLTPALSQKGEGENE